MAFLWSVPIQSIIIVRFVDLCTHASWNLFIDWLIFSHWFKNYLCCCSPHLVHLPWTVSLRSLMEGSCLKSQSLLSLWLVLLLIRISACLLFAKKKCFSLSTHKLPFVIVISFFTPFTKYTCIYLLWHSPLYNNVHDLHHSSETPLGHTIYTLCRM